MDWMNWNIGYAVAIGLLTVVVAGLAGHLASTKWWHKWVFWGAGLFIVVLIYFQAVSNERQARANANEQHSLRVQLDDIQARLDKNQKAVVGIFHIGLAVEGQELKPNVKAPFAIVYLVGNNVAKNLKAYQEIFTMKGKASAQQNKDAHSGFVMRAVKNLDFKGEDRIPGTGNFSTLELDLNQQEIQEALLARRTVYIMGKVEWNNLDGSDGHFDVCKWMQPPKMRYLIQRDLPFHDCTL
jgi:hypothetical protein